MLEKDMVPGGAELNVMMVVKRVHDVSFYSRQCDYSTIHARIAASTIDSVPHWKPNPEAVLQV